MIVSEYGPGRKPDSGPVASAPLLAKPNQPGLLDQRIDQREALYNDRALGLASSERRFFFELRVDVQLSQVLPLMKGGDVSQLAPAILANSISCAATAEKASSTTQLPRTIIAELLDVVDYSTIELCPLAQGMMTQFCQRSCIAESINEGQDLHRLVAAR